MVLHSKFNEIWLCVQNLIKYDFLLKVDKYGFWAPKLINMVFY
jgi:hypothetical protein